MANKTTSKKTKKVQNFNGEKKDLFNLEEYIQIFDTCENDSAVFAELSVIGEDVNDDIWRKELEDKGYHKLAKHLFKYWNDIDSKMSTMDKEEYIKYIQIFSLLENVFRNVLLRPYIPAYRVINKDCGRYRCSVTKSEEKLFKILNFDDNSDNQLIYTGTDSLQTIIYALTCNIFWHVLSMKLMEYHPSNT